MKDDNKKKPESEDTHVTLASEDEKQAFLDSIQVIYGPAPARRRLRIPAEPKELRQLKKPKHK